MSFGNFFDRSGSRGHAPVVMGGLAPVVSPGAGNPDGFPSFMRAPGEGA